MCPLDEGPWGRGHEGGAGPAFVLEAQGHRPGQHALMVTGDMMRSLGGIWEPQPESRVAGGRGWLRGGDI
jgi:hypothetical protein